METVASMVVGVGIGMWFLPPRWAKIVSKATLATTITLIFFMGVTLGNRDGFLSDLAGIGVMSAAFGVIPTVCSTAVVYALTSRFADAQRKRTSHGLQSDAPDASSGEERAMVITAILALLLGTAYGIAPVSVAPLDALADNASWILYALMFFVGITVGMSKGIVAKIRNLGFRILLVPSGTIVGTLIGGVVCSLACGMEIAVGTAVASGLGWYSLTGVVMTDLAGAQIGSIAFMSNLLREILSFFAIPWIAKNLNYLTCIAPAGATSEDTTLSMLIKCTDEETVVVSVINGIVCSAAVPVLIGVLSNFF